MAFHKPKYVSFTHSSLSSWFSKKGRYIRQERYAGSLSRSFYVGEDVEPQDVKAKYENGVLKLFVPKAEVKQVPAQTAIAIE